MNLLKKDLKKWNDCQVGLQWACTLNQTSQVTYICNVCNETLRHLGVAMGNAVSMTRVWSIHTKTQPVGQLQPLTSLLARPQYKVTNSKKGHEATASNPTVQVFRKNAEHLMCNLSTVWILECSHSLMVCTYNNMDLTTFYDSSGERRTTNSSEWEGTQTLRRKRHAHRWPSKVRGAILALPTRSSGERITHSSEWERTQTLRRECQAHRWPSKVRGAMLALPTRRVT